MPAIDSLAAQAGEQSLALERELEDPLLECRSLRGFFRESSHTLAQLVDLVGPAILMLDLASLRTLGSRLGERARSLGFLGALFGGEQLRRQIPLLPRGRSGGGRAHLRGHLRTHLRTHFRQRRAPERERTFGASDVAEAATQLAPQSSTTT